MNRTYDLNGNLTGGDNRTYTWNYDNKPSSVTGVDNVTEQYGYDGDTNRVYRSRNGITTFYLGQWEEDSTGVKKQYYSFGGSTVAMRDSSTNAVTYLHSDHLGSVSLATTSNGNIASQQYFDPWGKVKSGGIGQTSLNYTGQRLDGTGLLYYNARYYDPALGKFLTPDNITPGTDSQSYNRYTYVKNNPLKYSDPTGHYYNKPYEAAVEEHDEPMSDEEAQAAVQASTATQTSSTPRIQVPTTGLVTTTTAAAGNGIMVTTSPSATNTGGTTTTAFPGIVPAPATTGFPTTSTVCLLACINILTPGAFNPNISNNESDAGNAGDKGTSGDGQYIPDRELPKTKDGVPVPDVDDAEHTQLGSRTSKSSGEDYRQTREWDNQGNPVKTTDWTDHNRKDHTDPHDHRYLPNSTGGSPNRDKGQPMNA